eukprot:CAMPEP_0115016570 /NCGR_PEP_ID=MMETSP0216-20121206/27527_1 /TAXON_ID=223996 /ORGANISM="Protocruzia adherens, Strain Boccale" /LENGTH=271 /DNA_ID=CAMNT_0002387075 /DNA_START=1 /DNA_END=816 /DNA_ORIENTATION=-
MLEICGEDKLPKELNLREFFLKGCESGDADSLQSGAFLISLFARTSSKTLTPEIIKEVVTRLSKIAKKYTSKADYLTSRSEVRYDEDLEKAASYWLSYSTEDPEEDGLDVEDDEGWDDEFGEEEEENDSDRQKTNRALVENICSAFAHILLTMKAAGDNTDSIRTLLVSQLPIRFDKAEASGVHTLLSRQLGDENGRKLLLGEENNHLAEWVRIIYSILRQRSTTKSETKQELLKTILAIIDSDSHDSATVISGDKELDFCAKLFKKIQSA